MTIVSTHWNDEDGNPAGGNTFGRGFAIGWQNGPLGPSGPGDVRKNPNGAFVEDVIQAALDRLEFYGKSEFDCQENAGARDYLREALSCLDFRTRDRESRGVEGTNTP